MIDKVFSFCLVFRLLNALLLRTTFAPDEYWQATEVAHRLAFGYGHLTWEWAAGLRSYAHPTLIAAIYRLLASLRLDTPFLLAKSPMFLQAIFAALTDWHIYRLTLLLFNTNNNNTANAAAAAKWALTCQLLSWFSFYTSVRTYANCFEATFACVGVYYYLLTHPHSSSFAPPPPTMREARIWLLCAACSVVFRPPSAVFWLPLIFLRTITIYRHNKQITTISSSISLIPLRSHIISTAIIFRGTLFASALLDKAFYGRWVIVPWEFFKFNLLQGGSAQYGSHPWHWNVTQGLPAVLSSYTPLLIYGLYTTLVGGGGGKGDDDDGNKKKKDRYHTQQQKLLFLMCGLLSMTVYSLPAHKEFRFLLPAMELMMPYCGVAISNLLYSSSSSSSSSSKAFFVYLLLLIQVVMAAYFSLFHHSGLLQVVSHIREANKPTLLLTPCHSMPLYSHLHTKVPVRFLDCSPVQWREAVEGMNKEERSWLKIPAGGSKNENNNSSKRKRREGEANVDDGDDDHQQQEEEEEEQEVMICERDQSERQCFEANNGVYMRQLLDMNSDSDLPGLIVGYAPVMARVGAVLKEEGGGGWVMERRIRNCMVQTDDDTDCYIEIWKRV